MKEVTPQHDLQKLPLEHTPTHRWGFLRPSISKWLIATWMTWKCLQRGVRLRVGGYAGYVVLLLLLFAVPLSRLMLYAARSDFHSYIIVIPFISGYLLLMDHSRFSGSYRTSIAGTFTAAAIAVAAFVARIGCERDLSINDGFSLMALAFVSSVAMGGFLFFGSRWVSAMAFPITFLIFTVPVPDVATKWLEEALTGPSADTAALFFTVSGTPFVSQGTLIHLPGIVLRVAQECSGIHSSWVLFLTSLLASHVFLRTRWRRIVLVAFVIPLGIFRNGLRIFVIGLLCVHMGPYMIDSSIHRRGGPLFFVLSLVPLLLLLWWLRHQEMRLKLRG